MEFQKRQESLCKEGCYCLCHLRSRRWWRSPMILRNIVGFLSLHYSSLRVLEPACTNQQCNKYSRRGFRITLCLPRWFLSRAANAAAHLSPHGDPTAGLIIQRTTPEFATDSIYHLSQRNDVGGIEHLLKWRLASPIDRDDLNGCTPLHVRKPLTMYTSKSTNIAQVCNKVTQARSDQTAASTWSEGRIGG